MRVKDVMSVKPVYISPTTSLKEAAHRMRNMDFGFLPIGENDRLIGAITDRDITIRAVENGDPADTPVRDVMTKNIVYCFEDDPVEKAAESMSKLQVRRLVVLNKDKRLTGILTVGDIANRAKNDEMSGKVLNKICQP